MGENGRKRRGMKIIRFSNALQLYSSDHEFIKEGHKWEGALISLKREGLLSDMACLQ